MNFIQVFFLMYFMVGCSGIHPKPHKSGKQYRGYPEFHPRAQNPAYKDSHPRVCFDEGHNNLAVDQGFYSPILGLLESDGYLVARMKERFNQKNLKNCRILYISAVRGHGESTHPESRRSAFTKREMHAIQTWVRKGGALLLMTDHRPMSDAAAELLSQFGIYGSQINVRNSDFNVSPFTDPGIFHISGELINSQSPIVLGRNKNETLKKIFFFYGQALRGPKEADVFLSTGVNAKIGGIYGEEIIPSTEFPAAAVAVQVQKGRVVAFGDATVFTSKLDLWLNEKTGINRDGSDNVQMALNVFHWLSGIL